MWAFRRVRAPKRGGADLLRPVRATASRPGKRWDRHEQWPRDVVPGAQRHGLGLAGLWPGRTGQAQRHTRDRPYPLLDHWHKHDQKRAAVCGRLRARANGDRAQWELNQRRSLARRTGTQRFHFSDDCRQRDHFTPAGAAGRQWRQRVIGATQNRRCMFEYVYFARPDSMIGGVNVGKVRMEMGRELARKFPVEADIVVPVPDSGNYAALGFAQELKIPYAHAFVRNHYIGRTFLQPSQLIRDFDVRVKLNLIKEMVAGK